MRLLPSFPQYVRARLLLLVALVAIALVLNALGLHSFATGVWAIAITYSAVAFAGGLHTDMARSARSVLPFLAVILGLGVFAVWLEPQLVEAAVRFLLISYDQARALRTIGIVIAFVCIGAYLLLGARLPAVGVFLGGFWYATYLIAARQRDRSSAR